MSSTSLASTVSINSCSVIFVCCIIKPPFFAKVIFNVQAEDYYDKSDSTTKKQAPTVEVACFHFSGASDRG